MRAFLRLFCDDHRSLLLCLVLFFLPLQTRWIIHAGTLDNLYWEYGTISLYATDILILAFVASIFIPKVKSYFLSLSKDNFLPSLRFRFRPNLLLTTYYLLLSLVLWSFLSIAWSPDKLIAFYQSLKLLEGVLLFFAIKTVIASPEGEPSASYGVNSAKRSNVSLSSRAKLASLKLRRSGSRDLAFVAFIVGAIVQAALGSWQFLTQEVIANKWLGVAFHEPSQSGAAVVETALRRWLRAYGTLPHPNILGEYLVIGTILFIGALIIMSPKVRSRAFDAASQVKFLLWTLVGTLGLWVPYVLLSAGIFFTFSRAAWMMFVFGLVVFFLMSLRAKRSNPDPHRHPELVEGSRFALLKIILLPPLIFLILGTVFWEPTQARLTGLGRLEKKSIAERLGGYQRAWSMLKQHSILGTGIGSSSLRVSRELEKDVPAEVRARSLEAAAPVHNTPLLVFVELGVIGGLLYLAFLISILHQAFRAVIPSQAEGSRPSTRQLPAAVALLALALLALADHSFWTLHAGQMLFWVVAGLTARTEFSPLT